MESDAAVLLIPGPLRTLLLRVVGADGADWAHVSSHLSVQVPAVSERREDASVDAEE